MFQAMLQNSQNFFNSKLRLDSDVAVHVGNKDLIEFFLHTNWTIMFLFIISLFLPILLDKQFLYILDVLVGFIIAIDDVLLSEEVIQM